MHSKASGVNFLDVQEFEVMGSHSGSDHQTGWERGCEARLFGRHNPQDVLRGNKFLECKGLVENAVTGL